MPDWNEKKLGNGQTEENSEGVKDYVWQRQKTIPLWVKGAKKGSILSLFLFLVQIRQWSQRDLHGSTRGLSKYEYTTRMK